MIKGLLATMPVQISKGKLVSLILLSIVFVWSLDIFKVVRSTSHTSIKSTQNPVYGNIINMYNENQNKIERKRSMQEIEHDNFEIQEKNYKHNLEPKYYQAER